MELALDGQECISLYGERVPGKRVNNWKECWNTSPEGYQRVSLVSDPCLYVFRPGEGLSRHAAVIICPGGGYSFLSIEHEGAAVAEVLRSWGITAFVLKYRLPDDQLMTNKAMVPLQDAQRAIQLVRERASDWGIDPGKIGMMGFSAGGHVACLAGLHYATPVIPEPGGVSLRPDFLVLLYPVISFTDALVHAGSRERLLGRDYTSDALHFFSGEQQVTKDAPPVFLMHAEDDKTVKVENSLGLYAALLEQGVAGCVLHLYPEGGHGFGMMNGRTKDLWMERLRGWLEG